MKPDDQNNKKQNFLEVMKQRMKIKPKEGGESGEHGTQNSIQRKRKNSNIKINGEWEKPSLGKPTR